jgi:type 1 glutamine amidotransferase
LELQKRQLAEDEACQSRQASSKQVPQHRARADQESKDLLKVCLVSGSLEYRSDESLASFQEYVEKNFAVKCARAFRKADQDLPGLENLETADVAVLFTRRLTISGPQLERVKNYCRAGKPIVAIRTASHGLQNWLGFDHEILGGNYQNHYGEGPKTRVQIVATSKDHPILQNVHPFQSPGSLYRNSGASADIEVLLNGTIPDHREPVAWTRINHGGRVFYTSLGHPEDFRNENFRRLIVNAIFWTARRSPPKQ